MMSCLSTWRQRLELMVWNVQDVDVLDSTMPMILRGWVTCLLQVTARLGGLSRYDTYICVF
jgi:hypothetical protein